MASPLNHGNSTNATRPAPALSGADRHQLAFGRPVQVLEHTDTERPSPDNPQAHPLPANQDIRVRTFEQVCHADNEAQVHYLLTVDQNWATTYDIPARMYEQACYAGNEALVQYMLSTDRSLPAHPMCAKLFLDAAIAGRDGVLDLLLAFTKDDADACQSMLDGAAKSVTIQGDARTLQRLLQKGASIHGTRLLHLAAEHSRNEIVKLLLEAGAKADAGAGSDVATPLVYMVEKRGSDDCLCTLLEWGADPNRKAGNTGMTALAWACYNGDLSKVKILLAAEAVVDLGEQGGLTPLAWAVENRHEEIVRYLVDNGADVDAANRPCQAPLYRAAAKDLVGISRILLQAGAAPDLICKPDEEEAPLMLATQNGHSSLAMLLVEYGADIHRKAPYGITAVEYAEILRFVDFSAMLREKAAQQEAPQAAIQALQQQLANL